MSSYKKPLNMASAEYDMMVVAVIPQWIISRHFKGGIGSAEN